MSPDADIAVRLFFFGAAVVFGVEMLKAKDIPRYVFGALTLLAVLGGFAWPWIKGLWPETAPFVTRLAESPPAWFGLALAAYVAWKVGPPLRLGRRPPKVVGSSMEIPMLSEDEIERRAKIDTLWEAVHYLKDREGEHADTLIGVRATLADVAETLRNETAKRDRALAGLAKDLSEGIGGVIGTANAAAHLELHEAIGPINLRLDTIQQRVARNNQRFTALWHRELLQKREDAIRFWIKELDPFPSELVPTWEKWQEGFVPFKSHLESWREVAMFYEKNDVRLLFDLPAEMYKPSRWKMDFSQFPNDDAIHDFKSFRMIVKNFEKASEAARQAIDGVIFGVTTESA